MDGVVKVPLPPLSFTSITLTSFTLFMCHGDSWPRMFFCSLDSLWMSVVCSYNDDGPHFYMSPREGGQLILAEDQLCTKHSLCDDRTGVLKWSLSLCSKLRIYRKEVATKEDGKSLVIANIINRKRFVINDYMPLDLSLLFL